MKTKIIILALIVGFSIERTHSQIPVTDVANITQSVVNSSLELVEASSTAANMIKNFQETSKIFNQAKEYYEKLRNINTYVKDGIKVKNTLLMVGEITEIYHNSFEIILSDNNFTYEEIVAIANGYSKILSASSGMVKELQNIIQVTGMSMTDKERIDLIDRVYHSVRRYRDITKYYTRKAISVSYIRSQKSGNADGFYQLYGNNYERYF